ncbi:MAG: BrnT family toxin, partial [bacterium]
MPQFEWDERKRLSVLETRGVDFIDAVNIFDGDVLIEKDRRHRYGEERSTAIGETQGEY